ncbi:MAG: cell division protein CrgA [Actinomycetota bacterium]
MSPSEKSVDKASTAKPRSARSPHDEQRNPAWFKPVMFGFMLVGFLWVIVYYISGTTLPVPTIGSWNIVVGFGVMFIGFIMTTRWK